MNSDFASCEEWIFLKLRAALSIFFGLRKNNIKELRNIELKFMEESGATRTEA